MPTAPAVGQRGLVLVVEDEPAIADIIRLYLTQGRLQRPPRARRRTRPRCGRPAQTGRDHPRRRACRASTASRSAGACASDHDWTPVLFVTARDDEVDRIVGLELGADDYVTKPFSPRELVGSGRPACCAAPRACAEASPALVLGSASRLEPAQRRVFAGDVEVALTATEFDLLAYLMRRPGRVFSREQLLSEVWGYSSIGRHPDRRCAHRPAARQARPGEPGADRARRRLRRRGGNESATARPVPRRRRGSLALRMSLLATAAALITAIVAGGLSVALDPAHVDPGRPAASWPSWPTSPRRPLTTAPARPRAAHGPAGR